MSLNMRFFPCKRFNSKIDIDIVARPSYNRNTVLHNTTLQPKYIILGGYKWRV